MKAQPYLSFDGHCDEAIEFYKTAIGAKVVMCMRFKDSPEPAPPGMLPPGGEEKVMHATLTIGDSTLFMSDGHCTGKMNFSGFSLSLDAPSDADAVRLFSALSNGGKVTMPLGKTFFASSFGMCTDRFGLNWMVIVEPKT